MLVYYKRVPIYIPNILVAFNNRRRSARLGVAVLGQMVLGEGS